MAITNQSEEFYKVYKWMVKDLHLSGNDLVVYAIIYSFCDKGNLYVGSREYLASEAGSVKRTIDYSLKRLLEMGLIEKVEFGFKCVKKPFTMCAKSAQKSAKIARAKIAQNSAKFSKDSAKIAHNKIKDKNINIECSDSVIDSEPTHTLTHTENFLFDFFKSKIANEMDESCIRNLAKKFSNLKQAQLFAEFCEERKTNLNLGMLCKLHDEIFDKACEWDAQGRPRKVQKQPEQPPQPQPQMLPQQEIPEIGANDAQIWQSNQWRGQIAEEVRKHAKTAKKSWITQMRVTNEIFVKFPTPCDLAVINQFIDRL